MIINHANIQPLWDELYPKVYGYFFRRVNTRYQVEELTSATLNSFFLKRLELDTPTTIDSSYGYLWKIASYKLIDFFRSQNTEKLTISVGNYELFEESPVQEYRSPEYQERINNLMKCITSQLNGKDKELVEEVIINDRSIAEVARSLDQKPPTMRKRLSRALSKLRQHCREIWHQ